MGSFTVDTLLAAPKLSKDQQEIHETLTGSVGSDISLKYPKSGDNRSAYLVADIDGEPTAEAIVFYEYNSLAKKDSGIRLGVLDKDGGKWKFVGELAGMGTDVDKIIVSQLDRGSKVNVIVGYSTLSINEKALAVYSYEEGEMKLLAQDTYSVMETVDLNNDGYSEIITVQSGKDTDPATAALLSSKNGEITKENMIPMLSQCQSVVSYKKGKLTQTNKALFVDSICGEGQIQTEFVYYRHNALQDPVAQIGERLSSLTVRPDGYYCADVDGDGIIEIPSVTPLPGYELLPLEQQLYLTTWRTYENYYKLRDKCSGYYSLSNGYMLVFPEKWLGSVTVKKDEETGEAVFYVFDTSLDETENELIRITVSPRKETAQYLQQGYQVITSSGQLDYLVKISERKLDEYVPLLSSVKSSFHLVEQ